MKNNKLKERKQDGEERSTMEFHSDFYFPFFEKCVGQMKKDIFSESLLCKGQNEIWEPVRNRIEFISSLAIDEKELVVSHIPKHLARLELISEPKLIPEIPEWDGVDRLEIFAKALVDKNFTCAEVKELLTDFGVKMFRRILNPKIQNRVLVLIGSQGMGKDTFLNAVFGFLGQWQSNIVVTKNERDLCDSVSSLALAKITEIDRASKQDMAALKVLTTEDAVFYRKPYERAAVLRQLRCSFIATCNFEDFLSDPSGNRRFILFNISDLSWNFPLDQSAQVLAQFVAISKSEAKIASEATEAKLKKVLEEFTPEDTNDFVIEDMQKRIEEVCRHSGKAYLTNNQVMPLVVAAGQVFQISSRSILSLLKSKRYAKRYEEGMRYYSRPQNF